MGWLESDYYCETKLNPLEKLMGKAIDLVVAGQIEKVKKEQAAYGRKIQNE